MDNLRGQAYSLMAQLEQLRESQANALQQQALEDQIRSELGDPFFLPNPGNPHADAMAANNALLAWGDSIASTPADGFNLFAVVAGALSGGSSAPNNTGLIAASGNGMYTDGSIPYVTQGGEAGAAGRNGVPATGITLTPPRNTIAALTYNGTTLTIHYQSGATRSYPATSGRPGVTNPAIRDQGPIPSGVYLLNRSSITEGGFLRDLSGDWGDYRVPLQPVPGTGDTFGRSGFFLHGGSRPGSAGCIDCGRADATIFPILQRQPDPVPVIVTLPPK